MQDRQKALLNRVCAFVARGSWPTLPYPVPESEPRPAQSTGEPPTIA